MELLEELRSPVVCVGYDLSDSDVETLNIVDELGHELVAEVQGLAVSINHEVNELNELMLGVYLEEAAAQETRLVEVRLVAIQLLRPGGISDEGIWIENISDHDYFAVFRSKDFVPDGRCLDVRQLSFDVREDVQGQLSFKMLEVGR